MTQRGIRWLVWAAILAPVLVMIIPTHADPDLWGHVRFGLDWLQSHHVPTIDVYSFTQDRTYIDHEWLGEVLMGTAFSKAGVAGLIALKAAIALAALAVVGWRLRRATPTVSASVILLTTAMALPITLTSRPQTISLVGLALVIAIVDGSLSYPRKLVAVAVLFALWGNLHGGWITGLGALVAYTAVQWYFARITLARAIGIVVVPFTATLLNAYGFGLWQFLALTVRTSRPDITEWQPITGHSPLIILLSALFPIALLLVSSLKRETRPSPEIVAVVVVLAVGGIRVTRVAPLICPAVAAALGPCIAKAFGRSRAPRAVSGMEATVLAIPVVVLWIAALPYIQRDFRCISISGEWAPDIEAARHLDGTSGRLWVAFDWGEYAFWRFGPALRVSVDGRREALYSDAVIQMHRGFDDGRPDARAEFARLAPDYVWLRRNAGTEAWLAEHGYRMLVATDQSFVAAKTVIAAPTLLSSAPLTSCFP